MLPNALGPIILQLDPFHHQQGADTHDSTYLEYHEVALLHIVYQQVLNEVRCWEGVEQDAVDLRPITDSEDLGGDCWKHTQMAAVADVGEHYVGEVDLFDAADEVDCEGQEGIHDGEGVVQELEGVFLQDSSPDYATQSACDGSHKANH
jgi:hypothetical protein